MPAHTRDGVTQTHVGADYTPEETEFMMAMDTEKRRLSKVTLDAVEILVVVRRLGYRKVRTLARPERSWLDCV